MHCKIHLSIFFSFGNRYRNQRKFTMNKFILALAATAMISSPALADSGDTTSRLDVRTMVLSADGSTTANMMMDENVAPAVSGEDGASYRGPDVNDRPYDQYGNFRF